MSLKTYDDFDSQDRFCKSCSSYRKADSEIVKNNKNIDLKLKSAVQLVWLRVNNSQAATGYLSKVQFLLGVD